MEPFDDSIYPYFENPLYGLSLLIPLAYGIYLVLSIKRSRQTLWENIHQFGKYRLFHFFDGRKIYLKRALVMIALVLFSLALMDLRYGRAKVSGYISKNDIAIALDISSSMKAGDIGTSRLNRAKLEIEKVLQVLEGQRVALIAFAGSAKTIVPFTTDYNMVSAILQQLSPLSTSRQGSSLLPTLKSASMLFSQSPQKNPGYFLIYSDGEFHEEDMRAAMEEEAKNLANQSITIISTIIGTKVGAEVSFERNNLQDSLRQDSIRQDSLRSSQEYYESFLTQRQEEPLRTISAITGGEVVLISPGEYSNNVLTSLVLSPIKEKTQESHHYKSVPRFYFFVLPIICLLMLEWLITEYRENANKKNLRTEKNP